MENEKNEALENVSAGLIAGALFAAAFFTLRNPKKVKESISNVRSKVSKFFEKEEGGSKE
uniref:Uncharacterized protein n=1 Tax=candidate division CPR3 bacterium TaxID=2268181 RepID=A0A7C4R4D0_UNCC3